MKIIAAACGITMSLFGADFWVSKPFAEWNEKDAQKMLENSPWARPVSIATGDPDVGRSAGGGRRGSRGDDMSASSGTGGATEDPLNGGGGRGRDRAGAEAPSIATTT